MKKNIFLGIFALFIYLPMQSQNFLGIITNDKDEPLFGATVIWQGADYGTVADENGHFELPKKEETANVLVDYVGYDPMFVEVEVGQDTVYIILEGLYELMEIEVAAKVQDNYVSTLSPINIEIIGSGELRKAACCNLAESFTTNAAVDVGYSDAVTGAREIQLLGLRGTYTQLMVENRPTMGGLGTPFALEYLPGSWLSSIQISKGTSTVQNGYQAIAGQINSELVKPFEDKPLFINLYGSTFGRGEINVHLNKKINEKWSAGTLLHVSKMKNNLDVNDDNFHDTPQTDLLDGMFRLFYRGELFRAQFNVHALRDRHTAGQIAEKLPVGTPVYSIRQDHDRVEVFGKLGYLGFKDVNNSIGFITNASWHQLDSYYGNRFHSGVQKNAYANVIYSTYIGNTDHKFNMGGSYLYDNYDEMLDDYDASRMESVPGVFMEYSFGQKPENHPVGEENEGGKVKKSFWEGFGFIAGMRVDKHNLFGMLYTPRMNVKYNFSENSIVRLSAGRGFRTANAVAENVSLLASGRPFVVDGDLDMEDAWNFGVNYTQKFVLGGKEGSIALDAFRTDFNNQIIIDRQHDPNQILAYNLKGQSFSNSFLAVWSQEVVNGLDIKMGYKFNDVKMDSRHGFHEMPLLAMHRGLVTVGYETRDEKWSIHNNLQLVGRMSFPDNEQYSEELIQDHSGKSSAYATLGGQLTRKFDKWEIYIGGENLTNYTQKRPIIDADNPFGQDFNATQVYAPITGAMGYVGLRFEFGE
ncbi:MAG: outer membrane receptor for ferrienterochelin and colicins [Paraglaciecola sp.]|jgi:outer membrane receptor for ferrienterochelin and colicins